METEVLKIVAKDLLVDRDTLFHVSIIKGVKRIESAFSNDVVKEYKASKNSACVK